MVGTWLTYPTVYLLYSLAAGAVSGFYPYPFIDVGLLGYRGTVANSAGITIAYLALASLVIGVDRIIGRSQRRLS